MSTDGVQVQLISPIKRNENLHVTALDIYVFIGVYKVMELCGL